MRKSDKTPALPFFERVIAAVSPRTAALRALERLRLTNFRKFEAAGNGRRTEGWRTSPNSADREIIPALKTLRDRARDMVRNNPYAENAIETLTTNSVGAGIIPTPIVKEAQARTKIISAWSNWADTEQCDFEDLTHFYAIQELAIRAMYESGEVFVRRRVVSPRDEFGNPRVPFALQVLECDFLDYTKSELLLPGGGRIIDGKEYDKEGRAIAYWLFEQHPADYLNYPKSNRIPAAEIIHLYIKKRPGQSRGIPAGASSLLRLRDLDDYEDAQLIRQKIAACFAAFVQDSPEASLPDDNADADPLERIEPGAIETLPPGKQITFANPPGAEGYGEYIKKVLQSISAGYGVTYEAMTRDLSNVNFSSGRMGWLEFNRRMVSVQFNHFIPLMCNRVWRWFIDGAILSGILSPAERCRAEWTPPRREMIDPVKEVKGIEMEIRAGLASWSQKVRENGYDPKDVLAELAADAKSFDAAGLMLTSDARHDAARKLPTETSDKPAKPD